jgi:hypothetical protein
VDLRLRIGKDDNMGCLGLVIAFLCMINGEYGWACFWLILVMVFGNGGGTILRGRR